MPPHKPKLTLDEQIAHLKAKGVGFNIMDETAARTYLQYGNNYFKLAAYRKNYQKHPGGAKVGQYVRLEFAYLVDLAELDSALRLLVLQLALNIEHAAKLELLRLLDDSDEDGYTIVRDFIASLDTQQRQVLLGELARNRNNTYCADLVRKYDPDFPLWVFLELIPFGRLISLYKFCADRIGSKTMADNFYRLLACKKLRNAAAHSNCILSDIRSETARPYHSYEITQALSRIAALPKGLRESRMKYERINQLVILLYMHKRLVADPHTIQQARQRLSEFLTRMDQHSDYYADNPLIADTFVFVKIVVDSWFPIQ